MICWEREEGPEGIHTHTGTHARDVTCDLLHTWAMCFAPAWGVQALTNHAPHSYLCRIVHVVLARREHGLDVRT